MPALPAGTVTFLFTDIEGSTRRWQADPAAMRDAVDRHLTILRDAIAARGGVPYKVVGDAIQAAFPTAPAAVLAAVAAQQALLAEPWPGAIGPLRVRMALHTGEAAPRDGDYLAPALNRLARLLAAGHGEQILISHVVRGLIEGGQRSDVALRDLGEHQLRDLLEPERVWQVLAPGLPDQFPPLQSLSTQSSNLPVQPTALIGREREIAEVRGILSGEQTRLVTLTGPGGTGKTSLALQVAAELQESSHDRAFFVDVSSLTDAVLVLPAIAGVLELREAGGRSLRDALVEFLAPKSVLLLLDNLEQIRPEVAVGRQIADLLAACPNLRLLATSRSPLKIRAEREYPVLPLPFPPVRYAPRLDTLEENAAVRLFVERAQSARPTFTLTVDNAQAVAEICQRLDGLPLAIELAAARIRALSPGDLARRLGNRLDLLAGQEADRPDRQQTLRAAIAWSYDLLREEEQMLFRRLSVFAGGCTLEAAEAIAAGADAGPVDVLDGVSALLEQSLLRAHEANETTRYRMLETLRAYGQEQLARTGEEEAARSAHATIVLAATRTGITGLSGPDVARWIEALEAEQDNLRAALTWATGSHDQAAALALIAAAWRFWELRGDLTEGRMWLDQVMALPADSPSPDRAEALVGVGALARFQGDLDAATALTEEGLRVWQALGNRAGEGRALRALGVVVDLQGDGPRAGNFFQQSLDIAREAGDEAEAAAALNSLGVVLWNMGDTGRARTLLEESLAIDRRLGQRARLPVRLNNLALLAIDAGDLRLGRAYLDECLVIDKGLGNKVGMADSLENLGWIVYLEGDLETAARQYVESLEIRRELDDRFGVAYSLESIAAVAAATAAYEQAARLYGAAEALRAQIGAPLPQSEMARYQRGVQTIRSAQGESAMALAWQDGGRLPWMQAVAEALDVARGIAARSHPAR